MPGVLLAGLAVLALLAGRSVGGMSLCGGSLRLSGWLALCAQAGAASRQATMRTSDFMGLLRGMPSSTHEWRRRVPTFDGSGGARFPVALVARDSSRHQLAVMPMSG